MTQLFQAFGIRVDFTPMLILWGLIFVRTFTMLTFVPFLGSRMVLPSARTALSLVLATYIYIVQAPLLTSVPTSPFLIAAYFLKELFFGFSIGFVTQIFFYGFQAAGLVVDHQRGGANAQLVLPELGQVTIFGIFYYWLAIALFLTGGGHRLFLQAFVEGFQKVPLLAMPHLSPGFAPFLDFFIGLSALVLTIAAQLSAPVLIAVLLTDTVLGIANKMAPQINVFELGFAIKGVMGPLLVYVSLTVLVSQMGVWFQTLQESVEKVHFLFLQ